MPYLILLAMIAIPIVEIGAFIEVGEAIGLWPTLGLVIITAIIGTSLLRHQGLATLKRARDSLEQNRFPMTEVFDGICLLVAGALLLTPGFFTDAVGLALFIPVFRRGLAAISARTLMKSGRVHMASGSMGDGSMGGGSMGGASGVGGMGGMGNTGATHPSQPTSGDNTVIDGDFHEVDPDEPDGDSSSGGALPRP